MLGSRNIVTLAIAAVAAAAIGAAGLVPDASADTKKKPPRSVVKPPRVKGDRTKIKRPRVVVDCTKGFVSGTYPDDPRHARYYCKTTGLLCKAPYMMDKVEFKHSGALRRLYYTCRIRSLLGSGPPVTSGHCVSYFQNSMSAPDPTKHYFYFCISQKIKCSSATFNVQNLYTKISGNVGLGRYDCKSIY